MAKLQLIVNWSPSLRKPPGVDGVSTALFPLIPEVRDPTKQPDLGFLLQSNVTVGSSTETHPIK
jgi:hypothetical protein